MNFDEFREFIEVVISTIDKHYAGYGIKEMESNILVGLNNLYFKHHPTAEKYSITGTIDGKKFIYIKDQCHAVANHILTVLKNTNNCIWDKDNFAIEMQENKNE